jgi:prepilin-type N-terminal cleavage/methylation domain-containing protein
MTMTTRRGFTMIELMMGLVLTLLVGAVTYQLLANNQRVSRGQTSHVSLQDNVRAGALIISNELREVGYDAISATAQVKFGGFPVANRTDLVAGTSTGVSYFTMRGLAFTCGVVNGTPAKVIVKQTTYSMLRTPVSTDSLLVYVENDPATASDDAWVHLGIAGAPANQNCADGSAGWAFTVTFPSTPAPGLSAGVVMPNMVLGGPVRLAEVMRMQLYANGGKSWLGMKSLTVVGAQWEPVIGPLADSTASQQGLRFEYLDKANALVVPSVATMNSIRSVKVTLKGVTDERVRGSMDASGSIDTLKLVSTIALRNTLRP